MLVPNLRWDNHFLRMALAHAQMSKDPSTKVGAVLVGPDREWISGGFNGFPMGIEDSEPRLLDRATKYKLIVHAEMNAILLAARHGIRTKGCSMYIVATSEDKVWGGPPCTRCSVEVIQAGIDEVISYTQRDTPSRWLDDLREARAILAEAGIHYREI